MSIKKLFLIGVLGLSFCMTGCGNGQKVDSEKEFSTNDISEIVINNSSWNLKILASSDDKIHVSYDGKIEDGVSNIQILQNESQLVIQTIYLIMYPVVQMMLQCNFKMLNLLLTPQVVNREVLVRENVLYQL